MKFSLEPWTGRQYVLRNLGHASTELHGITSQKIVTPKLVTGGGRNPKILQMSRTLQGNQSGKFCSTSAGRKYICVALGHIYTARLNGVCCSGCKSSYCSGYRECFILFHYNIWWTPSPDTSGWSGHTPVAIVQKDGWDARTVFSAVQTLSSSTWPNHYTNWATQILGIIYLV